MVSTDDSKSFSLGSSPGRATPKLIALIKLNDAITPTGAKTLIIEEEMIGIKFVIRMQVQLHIDALRIKPATFFHR